MKYGKCAFCTDKRPGYPAGPQGRHVCMACRRAIISAFGYNDPWMVTAEACDACDGKRWGKMRMNQDTYRNTPCPVCDGRGAWFRKRSPLILLAECAE